MHWSCCDTRGIDANGMGTNIGIIENGDVVVGHKIDGWLWSWLVAVEVADEMVANGVNNRER